MKDQFAWWPASLVWDYGWKIDKIYCHPHRVITVRDDDSNEKVLNNWSLMFGKSSNSDNSVYVDSIYTDCDTIRINATEDKRPLGELRRIIRSN